MSIQRSFSRLRKTLEPFVLSLSKHCVSLSSGTKEEQPPSTTCLRQSLRTGVDKLGANRKKPGLFLPLALALSGCGLQPLYSGGGASPVATTLGAIEVAPIEGRAGWLVSNALKDRLQAAGGGTARYRLDVKLDDQIVGLGIRRDDAVTRERRTLRARFQLVDLAGGTGQGTGTVLLDATAGSDAGIDVVSSEYATIAAESTALENLSRIVADQIVTRVALYARRQEAAAAR